MNEPTCVAGLAPTECDGWNAVDNEGFPAYADTLDLCDACIERKETFDEDEWCPEHGNYRRDDGTCEHCLMEDDPHERADIAREEALGA